MAMAMAMTTAAFTDTEEVYDDRWKQYSTVQQLDIRANCIAQ